VVNNNPYTTIDLSQEWTKRLLDADFSRGDDHAMRADVPISSIVTDQRAREV
jgi:hypothetical protein